MGCQLSLFGVLLTYGLLPAGDEHHGIAIAKQLEQVLEQAQEENWRFGAIITDNAGQCGRARRILALRWPNIVLFLFSTSVNLLNASSSKWLPRARRMMKKCYGKALGLRTLCETRWNSMQGCFASLLRAQSALQMFFCRYKSYTDFPTRLQAFGDHLFWDELKEAEAVIAPLSYASYRLQRDENTLGDVVLSFRDIRRGFQEHFVRYSALVECVETQLPNTAVSGIGALDKAVVYYYRRLFSTDDIGQIRRDMVAWMKGRFTRQKASDILP
ncbi:uncharacterized protein PITG_05849 [Phytophthora infestans T30-4]|uniref:DUF659 domain-containing protein n=1 Tax=Phytophthora infestans (strain T30-4) TaxID=403677 RepID=D0N5U3_PHYIT|nr:uncharacterized protein PITG_05849 [Phytophthora infestans T30-4]EEY70434.1 conserved hypothetical protein [Phytophthora infestans T30-4]|eukprot:XP_002998088.1 conserved hypothetical protein [Phytophthora infestans T30-4]